MDRTMHRAQILLEREQHRALVEIAHRESRSMSDVVREIVRAYLEAREGDDFWRRRATALQRLEQLREAAGERYGVYCGDLVEEIREEREADAARVWRVEP